MRVIDLRTLVLAVALSLGACSRHHHASHLPTPMAPPSALGGPLTAQAIAGHVRVLASDEFEGREPASAAEKKTLDYIIAEFQRAGLQPGWRGGWLQPAPLLQSEVAGAPEMVITGANGARSYAFRDRQVAWTKRSEATTKLEGAELVFVGFGVVAPEAGWNDYAGIDMRGKVAVILVNDPDFGVTPSAAVHGKFGGRAMTYYGRWTYKFEEAARQGAAAALIIHETEPAAYGWPVVVSSWTGPQFDTARAEGDPERPAIEGWLHETTAVETLRRAGQDFAALKAAAQTPGFRAVPLGLKLSMAFETRLARSESYNVVGVLPGLRRADEAILYTAHWDHLGRCEAVDGDDICNGARDNATGVAGIIEIARRFAADGRTARSVGFIAFTAEEQGLLGSALYAADPAFPAAKTVAGINIDGGNTMGPTRDVVVVGAGKSELEERLARLAAGQSRVTAPEPNPERGSFYRSDHFNLAKIGIPMLYAGSGIDLRVGGVARGQALTDDYLAKRYHKPDDEMDASWNLDGYAQDLQLFYRLGREIADGEDWPNWLPSAEFRRIRDASRAAR